MPPPSTISVRLEGGGEDRAQYPPSTYQYNTKRGGGEGTMPPPSTHQHSEAYCTKKKIKEEI